MRIYLQLLLSFLLFILSGCWDRAEINDLAFVTASGIDKEEKNKFVTAVQVPLPGAMGGAGSSGGGGGTVGGPYYVDSEAGRNVRESNDNLQRKMSRKLYFGHRRIIVFGERIAREGFHKSLNVVLEQPQSRLSSFVLVTDGTSMKVLNATPHMEKISSEAIREMAKNYMDLSVKDVLNDIDRPGKDPVIPVVKVVKTKNGDSKDKKDEIMINGVGIFKGEKLVYFADREESMGAMWLLGRMKRKNFTFPVDELAEINVNINHVKIKVKPQLKGDIPSFHLNLIVKSSMMQNEPQLDLSEKKKYQFVTTKMEKEIKQQVESVLNHSKQKGIDVFGLGYYIYTHDNPVWEKKWENNWDKVLPEVEIKVSVKADIDQSVNPGIQIRE
jgi:spore germination protein KC